MWTGRGRSLSKTSKARATRPGISLGARTLALNAVKGAVTARWSLSSCSSPQPLPRVSTGLTEEITSMGTESE
jgi:hypothetical protein